MELVKKKLKLLAILILITFSLIGCSQKQDVNVTKVKESCKTPNVYCDFQGNTVDIILSKMLECISELKKANEVCK